MAEGKYRALQCAHCSRAFETFNVRAIYCGRPCNLKAWKQANPERWAEHRERADPGPEERRTARLQQMQERTLERQLKREQASQASMVRLQALAAKQLAKATSRCKQCQAPVAGRLKVHCSAACMAISHREAKAASRAIGKAQRRGAYAEPFSVFAVFARDRWHCQLCGISTPRSKRGTYDADAPELDHIRPISKGGAHTMANTQCACRRCNGLKSDRLDYATLRQPPQTGGVLTIPKSMAV